MRKLNRILAATAAALCCNLPSAVQAEGTAEPSPDEPAEEMTDEELEEPLELSFWDKTLNLRGAFGYKDNVLLSSVQRQGSAFWQTAADFTLFRASLDDSATFMLFATGEDRRYFSSVDVEKEQLFLTQARMEKPFADVWEVGAIAQYMYADQVFDASATEELFQTLPVKSHNLLASPFLVRELPASMSLELKLNIERQFFNDPLDDYWETGPELTWTKEYGNRSEVSLSYTFDHRTYDTRQHLDLEFRRVPGTSLRFNQHEFEAGLDHSWDKERHWRSRVRALFEINEDNGTGFYDYQRYRLSKRFGYFAEDWQATVEGRLLHYDYERQPVFDTPEIRRTWEFAVAFHVERTVWKRLKVFADSEHESAQSNYALEEYSVNTVLAGVDWEF